MARPGWRRAAGAGALPAGLEYPFFALQQPVVLEGCGVRRVVLAGGCFQNRLLLEGLIQALQGAGLEPLWAQQLPCSDGGLAVGQVAAARLAGV